MPYVKGVFSWCLLLYFHTARHDALQSFTNVLCIQMPLYCIVSRKMQLIVYTEYPSNLAYKNVGQIFQPQVVKPR